MGSLVSSFGRAEHTPRRLCKSPCPTVSSPIISPYLVIDFTRYAELQPPKFSAPEGALYVLSLNLCFYRVESPIKSDVAAWPSPAAGHYARPAIR